MRLGLARTWCLWLAGGWVAFSAMAVTPESWKSMTYSYRETPRSLGQILTAFSQAMGLKLKVNSERLLHQRAVADPVAVSPAQFMDRVGFVYGLTWFVHAGSLHVSETADEKLERIPLGAMTAASARQTLVGTGIFESKFGWGELDETHPVAIVTGPAAYIELVRSAVGRAAMERIATEPQLMVFPLKHASAADFETTVRDRTLIRPGVATTLRNLLSPSRDSITANDTKALGPIASARLPAADSGMLSLPGMSAIVQNPNPALGGGPAAYGRRSATAPVIDAYIPLNAVMVRDLPDRRPLYEALFQQLDVPTRKVEIVATIIDVDVGSLREWMPAVGLGGTRQSFSGQPGQLLDTTTASGATSISSGTGDPTIVLISSNQLSLKIRSLESNGKAQVQSRPSVLTLDNLGAVLDLSQSAYFKLLGERTADLKTVTVGTMLKVTPRVLGEGTDPSIRIDVDIEDGNLLGSASGADIGQAVRSFISTQAIMRPREALVIGGYQRDHQEKSRSVVPLFSKIPWIGRLFESDVQGGRRRERLFVLTARVVTDEPMQQQDVRPVPFVIEGDIP